MASRRPRLLVGVTVAETTDFLRGQLAFFRTLGYDVHVVSSPGTALVDTGRREGVTVHAVSMRREIDVLADIRSLIRICRLIARLRPDVVSAGTPKAGLLIGLAAFLLRTPRRVYVLRGLRLEGARGKRRTVLRVVERITCAAAHVVVCVSPSLRDAVVAEGLVAPEKTHVVGAGSSNGVDPACFARTEDRDRAGSAIRDRLGIRPQQPVIGFVGRLTRDKGLGELVTAHAMLRQTLRPPPALVVVGDAEGMAMQDRPGVYVMGHRDDISDCLRMMDVLALPSYREGFPNVVLEAACAEVPAIVSDATGSRDSVVDGVTGRIVPRFDSDALAAALRHMLENDEERRSMARKARRRAEMEFRPLDVWTGLAGIYDERPSDRSHRPSHRPGS